MKTEDDRASKIGQDMRMLAELGKFEANGHHADSLIEELDPTDSKIIASNLEQLNPTHRTSKALSNAMRALGRRKSRMNISRLLKRH